MSQISLTIPDGVLPRLVDAVAVKFSYDTNKQVNETKAQFAKRMLAETLKQWVKDGERLAVEEAHKTAVTDLETDVDTNITVG